MTPLNISFLTFLLHCSSFFPVLFSYFPEQSLALENHFLTPVSYCTRTETGLFSYVEGADNGPCHWGNLNPNWTKCETGHSQSPINIIDQKVVCSHSLSHLNLHYKPARAMIKNMGHDIAVFWTEDAGGLIIGHDKYSLKHCHWHNPSEHTINGDRKNMELHLVHINSNDDIAVIGILFEIGLPDPFLDRLSSNIGTANCNGTDLGVVDPPCIHFPEKQEYYRYIGSLTTPPCSENVTWTVIRTIRTASEHQITALKNVVHDKGEGNARPLQALNGRIVFLVKRF